jgi:hypothetical protein
MVQPADSLLRKNPTQSHGTNPTVRCLFLKSEMRTVLMETSLKYLVFDRDRKFVCEVIAAVKATRIIPKRTSFRSPGRRGRGSGEDVDVSARRVVAGARDSPKQNSYGYGRADQGSNPEEKQAEYGKELYQINHWKYCCKPLILQPARVLARHSGFWNVETKP